MGHLLMILFITMVGCVFWWAASPPVAPEGPMPVVADAVLHVM
jgi:hypothetical protein